MHSEELLISNYVEDPLPLISEQQKESAITNGYMISTKQHTGFNNLEFEEENNEIEEAEYPLQCEEYDNFNSVQEIANIKCKNESLYVTPNTNEINIVENNSQPTRNTLKKSPSFPLSPWNQSITLEDKVQRFLAQAAELAHQNGRITSDYSINEPVVTDENQISSPKLSNCQPMIG